MDSDTFSAQPGPDIAATREMFRTCLFEAIRSKIVLPLGDDTVSVVAAWKAWQACQAPYSWDAFKLRLVQAHFRGELELVQVPDWPSSENEIRVRWGKDGPEFAPPTETRCVRYHLVRVDLEVVTC